MNSRTRLPLNALRVLEAVGRHRSLADAADELHVAPSAVSMQMKSLSDYVGAPLLRRVGRGVELTPAGHALLPAVTSGLQQIDDALRQARIGRSRDFHLSALPSFMLLWLLPRMPDLIRLSNSLGRNLVVSASKALADLRAGEIDAAIRLGSGRWPGLHAQMLSHETLVPVCAPELAHRIGTLEPGRIPAGVALLSSRLDPWDRWCERMAPIDQADTLTIDDATAVVMLAERGSGLALARGCLVAGALASRRLVQVGPSIPYRFSYYWVSRLPPRDDAFGSALASAVVASPRMA